MKERKVYSPKIMVLGVDGMDPRLSRKYVDEGKMPNLKKLIERGAQREDLVLIGAQPTVTPPQWTTLAYGCYPSTHGITQFSRTLPGKIAQTGYNLDSRLVKAEPSWNCLAEAGRKTLVFHWPGGAWPPTSDSENLFVLDGSSTMQVDAETVVGASVDIAEATFNIRGAQDAATPCVIKREEKPMEAPEMLDLSEGMRMAMQMNDDMLDKMRDADIETTQVLRDDSDGFGTRGGDGMNPSLISSSPIKDATGWASAPADAKEFTILLSKGLVRRVGLILKNKDGIYDKVEVYKNKKETTPITTLEVGKMVYNVIDEAIFADQVYMSNRHYKLIKLEEDASELKMYVSAAMELDNDQVIHPKRLHKALLENVGPYPPQAMLYVQDEDIQLCTIEVWDYVVDWYVKCFDYLIENEGIEYIYSHLHSIDIIEHTFIRYMYGLGFNKYPREVYAGWMERLYVQTDRYIGDMLHYLDEGWTIIVTSDHAQVAPKYMPPAIGDMSGLNAGLMKELGYTVLAKDENGNELKKVDWSKTRAVAIQGNDIFINLKGREKYGIVDPEDQYELEEQIMTDLYNYKHPDTGKRVIALALRNRDAILLGYGGPTAGDICFWVAEGYNYDHCDGLSVTYGEASTSLSPIFVAAGPGLKQGFVTDRVIRQVDVAPTMCYLAGVRMPAQCEGSVIYQILEEEL